MIARILAVALLGLAALTAPARAQTMGERASMVVELYTSQGCTQCPRANRLLGQFARDEHVLALTFAVDMWDYLGWEDTFALPESSDRQRAYSRALRAPRLTPQLFINGSRQMSAADWDDVRAAIESQRQHPLTLGANNLSLVRLRSGRVRVSLGSDARAAGSEVWLIGYNSYAQSITVLAGANRSRTVMHYNLVRTLERLGTWDGHAAYFERPRCLPDCAVIVQGAEGGPILGAAYISRRRPSG